MPSFSFRMICEPNSAMCASSSSTVMPSTPGLPLFFLTFLMASFIFFLSTTRSINEISFCLFISVLRPYALLHILLLPAYPSVGSHLYELNHDVGCDTGGVSTSLISKIVIVLSFLTFVSTMTSADFSSSSFPSLKKFDIKKETSPGKNDNLLLMSLLHLLYRIRAVLDFTLFGKLIRPDSALVWSFCSSVRAFASDFLQIPPHGGHPCHSLTVPTAKPVVDFHHQVVAHAGRTKKTPSQ